MKYKTLKMVVILVISLWIDAYGQSRNDILIFVEPTLGGSLMENVFFDENVRMEIYAANYTITSLKSKADYVLVPMVVQNRERDAATTRSLVLRLLRNDPQNTEVVQVGVAYDDVTETYEWNLYLVYQAMANVPLTKNDYAAPPYNYWRDKWIYLGIQGIYNPQFIIDQPDKKWWPTSPTSCTGALSLEFQVLPFLSVECMARPDILFYEPENRGGGPALNCAFPFTLRYIIKPGDSWMLEPYAGVALNIPVSNRVAVPRITPLAGIQAGAKMGRVGAIFFTVEFDFDREAAYQFDAREHRGARLQMFFGAGIKFGFINRTVNENDR
jgi:hypothetical protein